MTLSELHLPVGIFIAALGFLGVLVPIFRDLAKMGKSEKAFWTALMFILLCLEIRSIYSDRAANEAKENDARATQLQGFKDIGEGIKASIANSDKQFAATMGKTSQVLENITGGKSFAIVTPQVWSGLVPIPLSIRNYGEQTLTGITVTIYNSRAFDVNNPRSFYEAQLINVGTLHPGEVRLLKETLTPLEGNAKGPDGLPVDLFQLDIGAQNFTAKEYLFFKKGTRIPWLFRYMVTQQFVKSKRGDTTNFGYNTLADQKEWLGEKSK